jgi:hypothetical protein
MTNDPKTNPMLSKYEEKLPSAAEETLKNVTLAEIASYSCVDAAPDMGRLHKYADPVLRSLSQDDLKETKFQVRRQFQGLDFNDVAEICAGLDYLFGPAGVLISNAVSKGSGQLRMDGPPPTRPLFDFPGLD